MDSSMKCMKTAAVEEEKEEISIYLIVTKTIKLNVKESDSVGNVKALLQEKEGIPVCHQQLFSKDNMLVDGRKLVDYGICKNSTLHAYVEDMVPVITLCVKRSYPTDIIIVYPKIYDTIRDVKSRIAAKEGINSGEFSLIHDGKFLEDDKTLSFLNIDDGSVLRMVINPRDKFLIFVIMETHGILRIEVKATLLVCDVKTIIESKVYHSIANMDLFMGEQKLDDQKELYHYDIKEDSFLDLLEACEVCEGCACL